MSFDATRSRLRTWATVFASISVVAAVVAIANRQKAVRIDPGTEVLAVEPDGIRTLDYRTAAMTLAARRRAGMEPFAVDVFYSDGRPAQHCQAARDLAGLLPGLAKIVARRQLTPQQAVAEFPVQLGTLMLGNQIPSEPIGPIAVRATRDRTKMAVVLNDAAVETTTAPAVFEKLEQGCDALAVK